MSSVSRGNRSSRPSSSTPPGGVYEDMVGAFERLVDEPNVLIVELATSGLLGIWWDTPLPGLEADAKIGGQLIEYARESASRPALAALRSIAALAVDEMLRDAAGTAATDLAATGLAEPVWHHEMGRTVAEKSWKYRDGEHGSGVILIEFSQQEKSQALVVFFDPMDKNGRATDITLTGDAVVLVRELRKKAMASGGANTLEELEPADAALLIEQALRRTDELDDPDVDKQYGQLRALAYARCRTAIATEI